MKNINSLKRLIKKQCACYFIGQGSINHYCCTVGGVCLFFEKERSERCKYFEDGVLPLNIELEHKYYEELNVACEDIKVKPKPKIHCKKCGKHIEANSNRQEYCESCRKYVKREQDRVRQQKRREKSNCHALDSCES